MRVAVFGASGFIGINLMEELKRRNYDVIPADVKEPPIDIDGFVKADIRDMEDVERVVRGADFVIHLAAHPLKDSIKDPVENAKVNVVGTLNVLEASKKFGVKKIVFTSASSLIGEVKYNPVDEEHPCKPKTPYAVAKYAIEHYLRVYKELYDLDHLVFRLWNVYGPWQMPESGALIPTVISRISNGEEVFVFGDGSQTRDFIYVEDVAKFLVKSVELDVKNEVVNLGSGKGTKVMEVIETVSKVIGKEAKIVKKPKRKGEIQNFYSNIEKLEKLFGDRPKTSLEDGIKKTYNWFRSMAPI